MTWRKCVILSLSIAWSAHGQDTSTPSSAKPEKATILWHKAEALLPTRVLLPQDFDARQTYPLVIALHGYGSSAEAFQRVARKLSSAGFVVAVPECPYPILIKGKIGYDWTLHSKGEEALSIRAGFLAALNHIPAVVTDLRQRYKVDRCYALGFSQGAVLALITGIYNNGLFDGIVLFGLPGYDEDWFPGDTLAAGSSVRVVLVHGREDERASFAISKRARDWLTGNEYNVTLHPFSGGHTMPDAEIESAVHWMNRE